MGVQDFGEKFDLAKLIRARNLARDITTELSALIKPGMTEDHAQMLYKGLLKKHGVEKQWHPPKLRFGPNTLKDFYEPSIPHVLKDNDVFFVDIGPVVDGHEADFGETFYVGNEKEHKHIVESSRIVFDEVAHHWRTRACTGPELYTFAQERAREHGYELILSNNGHRIGDFPHHVHFKGGLEECEEIIVPNAWILEIHLRHSKLEIGAFYEDLLSKEE